MTVERSRGRSFLCTLAAVVLVGFSAVGAWADGGDDASPGGQPSGTSTTTPPPASTGGPGSAVTAIPLDQRTTFRVGVSAFTGNNLSDENAYLLEAIPLVISQQIAGIDEHTFQPDELLGYQTEIVEQALTAAQSTLDQQLLARSALVLASGTTKAAVTASDTAITAQRNRIAFLEELDPGKISVAAEKPVEMVTGSQGQGLLPAPAISADDAARQDNVDILIGGSVTQVEDFVTVRIFAYNVPLGRNQATYQATVAPNDALSIPQDIEDAITAAVFGRDFAVLRFQVDPGGALVYVDGNFIGLGTATDDRAATGDHLVTIRAPGFADDTLPVTLSPFERKSIDVRLSPVSRARFVLHSDPEGAAVYLSSQYQGKTPLVLNRPSGSESLLVRMDGYADSLTAVGETGPRTVTIKLLPDVFDHKDYVTRLRDRFYGSFGAFAVSLILPVAFNSLFNDYYVAAINQNANNADRLRLQRLDNVWYAASWGGAFVSAALFANTAFDTAAYIGATQ